MKIYDFILQGEDATNGNAILATGAIDFTELTVYDIPDMYTHSYYVDTVNGIAIYYDFGADYYYFADPE